MSEEKTLQNFANSIIPGSIYLIIVSDCQTGDVLQKYTFNSNNFTEEDLSQLSTAYSSASIKSSKLKLGSNEYMLNFYTNYAVLNINFFPLTISVITSSDCNIGIIIGNIPSLKSLFQTVKDSIPILPDNTDIS